MYLGAMVDVLGGSGERRVAGWALERNHAWVRDRDGRGFVDLTRLFVVMWVGD